MSLKINFDTKFDGWNIECIHFNGNNRILCIRKNAIHAASLLLFETILMTKQTLDILDLCKLNEDQISQMFC